MKVVLWQKVRGTCGVLIERDAKNPTSFEPCGRPAKGSIDGKPACGIHLAAANKRASVDRNIDLSKEKP